MSRAINLDAAVWVTQLSKRTLWRRLSEGQITRQDNDDEGRTMLTFEDIVPMLCIPVAQQDYDLIVEASAGDAEAQNNVALLFLDALHPGQWYPQKRQPRVDVAVEGRRFWARDRW
jgi:hypothetical protein